MSKVAPRGSIASCWQCVHHRAIFDTFTTRFCRKEERVIGDSRNTEPHGFPDWCPLEEYLEGGSE